MKKCFYKLSEVSNVKCIQHSALDQTVKGSYCNTKHEESEDESGYQNCSFLSQRCDTHNFIKLWSWKCNMVCSILSNVCVM